MKGWNAFLPKDLKVSNTKIFHPHDDRLIAWNRLFVLSCMFSLYVDPFLFYFPSIRSSECLTIFEDLVVNVTLLRFMGDCFYAIHMYFQFHTAYIRKVLGNSNLVTNPAHISTRYWRGLFLVDFLSLLPLPLIAIWVPFYKGTSIPNAIKALLPIVCLQYIPRIWRVYPLIVELQKTAGAFPRSSLAGAVYYLLWYFLVSHILGASWYLLAVERNIVCWSKACSNIELCDETYMYCSFQNGQGSFSSMKIMQAVIGKCSISADNPPVAFGIYKEALTYSISVAKNFLSLYLYSFWWGLKQLSTLGQGLETGIYAGEIIFSVSITLSGVVHSAFLIGNMHDYLKSFTNRLEELRYKKREMEQWMCRRSLPQDLRQRVGGYNQYRWWETGGVDEETLLQSLPRDIRRDVKRHLCMDLIRKVPLFGQMDELLLDAFCERLKSSLYTEGTYIVQVGDPVNEMVFITHGQIECLTSSDRGTSTSISLSLLKEGDFCGEELLPWALDPQTGSILPLSSRMVHALTEVEAFTITPEDLKFLSRQFKGLHTQQAKRIFRFYSQQWRTWAACCIQRAWRRGSERKKVVGHYQGACYVISSSLTSTLYALRFINSLRGARLKKPPEPDFLSDTD